MYSINNVVKEYLNFHYPHSGDESVHNKYWIRFELGAPHKNGTRKRIDQVVFRATTIFEQAIVTEQLVLIIEEFHNDFFDQNNEHKPYLYSLLDPVLQLDLTKFPGPFDLEITSTDNFGAKIKTIEEKIETCDIILCKLKGSEIDIRKIILGMANLEMGFSPCIPQRIRFLNPLTGNSFYMYDDRGCDVRSPRKEGLLHLYNDLSQWILDYNRKEIDTLFK